MQPCPSTAQCQVLPPWAPEYATETPRQRILDTGAGDSWGTLPHLQCSLRWVWDTDVPHCHTLSVGETFLGVGRDLGRQDQPWSLSGCWGCWPPKTPTVHSLCSIVLGALPVHLEGAGDVHRHAGVLDEQVLHGAAPHAVGAGLLCSKTGGRGDKPTLVHQAGTGRSRGSGRWRRRTGGRRAGPRRAPGTASGRAASGAGAGTAAWGGGAEPCGTAGTHTHTMDGGGREGGGEKGASLVRETATTGARHTGPAERPAPARTRLCRDTELPHRQGSLQQGASSFSKGEK